MNATEDGTPCNLERQLIVYDPLIKEKHVFDEASKIGLARRTQPEVKAPVKNERGRLQFTH